MHWTHIKLHLSWCLMSSKLSNQQINKTKVNYNGIIMKIRILRFLLPLPQPPVLCKPFCSCLFYFPAPEFRLCTNYLSSQTSALTVSFNLAAYLQYWCKPISLSLRAPGWNLNWHFMSEGVSHCECWLFSPFPTLFNHRFPVTAARRQKCIIKMFFLKCAWYKDYSLHTNAKV